MKYPNALKKEKINTFVNHKNRGMSLEQALNMTNGYYLENDIAVIHKKPTPIKVLETKYKEGQKQIITKAFYDEKSTTDYNGVYKGIYIDFEAKETVNKTLFPLSNIKKHQIEHMKKVIKQNGVSFIIISFIALNKIYLLKSEILINEINNNKRNITIDFLEKNGYLIKEKINPRIDYLSIINSLYFKEDL